MSEHLAMEQDIRDLTARAKAAEGNLAAIAARVELARRQAADIEDAEHDNLAGMAVRLATLYAHALEDIGLIAGITAWETWQPQIHKGSPCRRCGRLAREHPVHRASDDIVTGVGVLCAKWS